MSLALRIRVATDFTCPWCFLAEHRLARALVERPDLVPVGERLPYLLNPDLPAEGIPYRAHLERKLGGKAQLRAAEAHLEALGHELDIPFDFGAIHRLPSTVAAHALVKWAAAAGVAMPVVDSLYRAHFCEGRDLGDRDTLVDLAATHGLDAGSVRDALTTGRDQQAVREVSDMLRTAGIHSVPLFIFGAGLAVQGAQPESVLLSALDQVVPAPERLAASWS